MFKPSSDPHLASLLVAVIENASRSFPMAPEAAAKTAATAYAAGLAAYAFELSPPGNLTGEVGVHAVPMSLGSLEGASACTSVPFVPAQGQELFPRAYEKSSPYWFPDSPQRWNLMQLAHDQARLLLLPSPTKTEIEALLNPFSSPIHEALAAHVRHALQLDAILCPQKTAAPVAVSS